MNKKSVAPLTTGRVDAPAFDEPWQAQAFALTVALNEAGHLDWSDWAQHFSAALQDAGLKGVAVHHDSPISTGHSAEDNAAYYRAWLAALEALARERQWALPLQLGARRESIRAYNGVAHWARTRVDEP